jgi:ADP-heptose:LPS heptosyltransferase
MKLQLPDAEIHYLIKPKFKPVMVNNPYIDKLHVLGDWEETVEMLRKEQYDYIIDLHHNLTTLRLKRALKVPHYSFYKLNIQKFIFVKLKWNVMPPVHIIDRYLDTVKPFGVENDGMGMDYFISMQDEVRISDIPTSHQAGYIAIVIGASFYTKKLPVYKLQELCKSINHPVMLLGGPEDVDEAVKIAQVDPVKIYNACGKFSLNESADLVKRSKLVIAHDTGLMHIAAALKKQVIAIWGSTTPSFGMVPYYGDRFLMSNSRPYDDVQVHGLWCRPGTKIGRHKCPQGHFKCMKKISIDQILQLVKKRLK